MLWLVFLRLFGMNHQAVWGGAPPAPSNILLEDGTSKLLMEDGTSKLLME
jgi:hypothetical protein